MSTEIATRPDVFSDPAAFQHSFNMAKVFANSELVPAHFRGKPENCFIAMQLGHTLGINPFMALQNIYVVYGQPGMSASLVIALANKSGLFAGPIMFEETGTGDSLSVTARATFRADNRTVAVPISLAQARKAGWTRSKDGEKPMWAANPVQMLKYRSACFLIRAYAPEVILGLHTDDELRDSSRTIDVSPEKEKQIEAVAGRTEDLLKRGPGRPRKVEIAKEDPDAEMIEATIDGNENI